MIRRQFLLTLSALLAAPKLLAELWTDQSLDRRGLDSLYLRGTVTEVSLDGRIRIVIPEAAGGFYEITLTSAPPVGFEIGDIVNLDIPGLPGGRRYRKRDAILT